MANNKRKREQGRRGRLIHKSNHRIVELAMFFAVTLLAGSFLGAADSTLGEDEDFFDWDSFPLAAVGTRVKQLSAGAYQTCILEFSGNVHCWGEGWGGWGADNTYSGGDATYISAGSYYPGQVCMVLVNGNVDCAKYDLSETWTLYSRGDAKEISLAYTGYYCILLVSGSTTCGYQGGDAVQVDLGYTHRCVLLASGNIECWGWEGYPAGAFLDPYLGGDAVQVAVGYETTCALLLDSSVKCWGWRSDRQLDAGAQQISTNFFGDMCALLVSGEKYCWGLDHGGVWLGPGLEISAGSNHACSLRWDGFVGCWGDNSRGQAEPYTGDLREPCSTPDGCIEYLCEDEEDLGQCAMDRFRETESLIFDTHRYINDYIHGLVCGEESTQSCASMWADKVCDELSEGASNCNELEDEIVAMVWEAACGEEEDPVQCAEDRRYDLELLLNEACGELSEGASNCNELEDEIVAMVWEAACGEEENLGQCAEDLKNELDAVVNEACGSSWEALTGEHSDCQGIGSSVMSKIVDGAETVCPGITDADEQCARDHLQNVTGRQEIRIEGDEWSASVNSQEIFVEEEVVVEEQKIVVDPVETPETCNLDPCPEETKIFDGMTVTIPGVPAQNVSTPATEIPETCAPVVICVGPFSIPGQNITETPPIGGGFIIISPFILPAVCSIADELCLEPVEVFPGLEETTPRVEETVYVHEETPRVKVTVALDDIEGVVDPFGPPTEVGPFVITVPTPFGPFPVTLCPEGCPVPATMGEVSLETAVTVTIWVGDEVHSERVAVEM